MFLSGDRGMGKGTNFWEKDIQREFEMNQSQFAVNSSRKREPRSFLRMFAPFPILSIYPPSKFKDLNRF